MQIKQKYTPLLIIIVGGAIVALAVAAGFLLSRYTVDDVKPVVTSVVSTTPAGTVIQGTATDFTGSTLAGATVEMYLGDALIETTQTDAEGGFLLHPDSGDDFTVRVTAGEEQMEATIDPTESTELAVSVPVLAGDANLLPPVEPADVIAREDGFSAISGEIVVGWDGVATLEERKTVITAAGAQLLADKPEIQLSLLQVSSPLNDQTAVDNAILAIESNEHVTAATPSYILEANIIPTEAAYEEDDKNWWLKKVNAEPAWEISTGSPWKLVGVVDGGYDLEHEDLSGAFVAARANFTKDPGYAAGSHGTHVTGIIGMRLDNSKGLVGIAPNTRMAVTKSWDLARIADAFYFFSRCPSVKVVSISQGFNWWSANARRREAGLPDLTEEEKQRESQAVDRILKPAVDALVAKDVLIVHSAGNDAGSAMYNTMNFDEVMTVASSTKSDTLSGFSNYGARVDVAAPGSSIWSAVPDDKYEFMSGTSMATPLVAGTAALIRAANPSLNYKQVKESIVDSAVKVTGLSNAGHTFGRLDAWRALLKATNQLGVEGYVFDLNQGELAIAAWITDHATATVASIDDPRGFYRIPALPWKEVELEASKAGVKDTETATLPIDDVVNTEVDFTLYDEALEDEEPVAEEPAVVVDKYVIWDGTNANVGLHITTETSFNRQDLARGYSGGGIDPEMILEKELFSGTRFDTFEEANEWICSQMTDVRVWPLGAGLHGKIGETAYGIGNFNCSDD